MTDFSFTIPGEPQTKGRPRFYKGRILTPPKTHEAELKVLAAFRDHYPAVNPLTGEIHMMIICWMSTRQRKDYDNLAKLVCDALNGTAYWDDAQIVRCLTVKKLPSLTVPGTRSNQRKRHGGDPLTTMDGQSYDPHTDVFITDNPTHF